MCGCLVCGRAVGCEQTQLEEEDLKDRIVWRMARLEALLQVRTHERSAGRSLLITWVGRSALGLLSV